MYSGKSEDSPYVWKYALSYVENQWILLDGYVRLWTIDNKKAR